MKFLQTILIAFAICSAGTAFAEEPTPNDLRNSAEAAADATNGEANDGEAKDAAEKVVEATVGEGATLPSADAEAGLKDGVDDIGEASVVIPMIVKAFQDKNWAVFVGGLLMLLIFLLNKFGVMAMLKLEGWKIAAFSIGLGVVSQVAVELLFSDGAVVMAIFMGISNGLVATGFYEVVKLPFNLKVEKIDKPEEVASV